MANLRFKAYLIGRRLFLPAVSTFVLAALAGCVTAPAPDITTGSLAPAGAPKRPFDERVAFYALAYDVPESLIHRSIQLESGYDPGKHAGPYWGLMQIRLDTARTMGYRGPARGLLNADTNLKYAVAYLANAYTVADRDPDRALRLYASGYFWEAKRKAMLDRLRTADDAETPTADP